MQRYRRGPQRNSKLLFLVVLVTTLTTALWWWAELPLTPVGRRETPITFKRSRRPPIASNRTVDPGFIGNAIFYGLVSDGAVTSQTVLSGVTKVARDPCRHNASASLLLERKRQIHTGDSSRQRRRQSIVLCARTRDAVKIAVEWVAWHALVGATELLILDDASTDGLSDALRPFVAAGVVTLMSLGSLDGLPLHDVERIAAEHCLQFARARRVAAYAFLAIHELIVAPAKQSLEDIARELLSTRADALALPLVQVGHGSHFIDASRSAFERTNFAAGDLSRRNGVRLLIKTASSAAAVAPVSASPTSLVDASVVMWSDNATHRKWPLMERGSAQWPKEVNLSVDCPRVIQYISRSLAAVIHEALVGHDDVRSSDVFDLAVLVKDWEQHAMLGFRPFSSEGTAYLLRLHRDLLASLGHNATALRQERIVVKQSKESRKIGLTLLRQGVIVPGTENWTAPSLLRTVQWNAALASGAFRVAPERPLVAFSQRHVDEVTKRSRCTQRSTVNITFCCYVRNRAKITLEWIQWHRLLGVRRFIIVDDDSSNGLRELLQPLIDSGIVEVWSAPTPPYYFKQHPVKGGLLAAYAACDAEITRRHGDSHHEWIGFLDSDEFVALHQDDCLEDFILNRSALPFIGGVALPWVEVSHTGELRDVFPTQLNRTGFAAGVHDPIERVKCIVRAGLSERMETAHRPFLKAPWTIVRPDGTALAGEGWFSGIRANSTSERSVTLLHYHARSLASWIQRALDGFADDDNKVWSFDLHDVVRRWISAQDKGFRNVFGETSRVRQLHTDLLAALSSPEDPP